MDDINKPILMFEANGFYYVYRCDKEEHRVFIAYQNIGEISDVYVDLFDNHLFVDDDSSIIKGAYCCFDVQYLCKKVKCICLFKPAYTCRKWIKYTKEQYINSEISYIDYFCRRGYKNPNYDNFKQSIKPQLDQDIIELKQWQQKLIDNFNQWKQPKNTENNII